jgi:hypothetical protein
VLAVAWVCAPACVMDEVGHDGSCPTRELPSDFDGEDIELLRGYTRVGGDLVVPGDTEDLSALRCLEEVDGSLVIVSVDGLGSLAGLEGLRSVGSLRLSHMDSLENTDGLAGLREIRDGMELWGLPRLRTITAPANLEQFEGSIVVHELPALEEWDAPIGPTELVGYFEMVEVAPGASIGAFSEIERASDIYVAAYPSDVPGDGVRFDALEFAGKLALHGVPTGVLGSLREVGELRITEYLGADLEGLAGLQRADMLLISESPNLQSLAGLEQLRSLHGLDVLGNDGLVSLAGLEGLREFTESRQVVPDDMAPGGGGFVLAGCPLLSDTTALAGIETDTLGGFTLESLPSLTSVPSIPALRRLGGLAVIDTAVEDLDALSGVTTLERLFGGADSGNFSVELTENPALHDISGLTASLTSTAPWGDLRVNDNPMLPTCAVEALATALDGAGRMDGAYDVSGTDDAAVCE